MTSSFNPPNINYLWTELLIEELIRQGVSYFCIAPGSRSAPLAAAVARNPKARSFLHWDERALGFHALGYARASGEAAAIITTSGTAAGNLFPAVIEASASKIPLIVLTADRPPELRDCGANQAIDQHSLFGSYTRWFHELPCPTSEAPATTVLTTVAQLVSEARGTDPGPVQLNCLFREPLSPKKTATFDVPRAIQEYVSRPEPYTALTRSISVPVKEDLRHLAVTLEGVTEGVVVLGELPPALDRGHLKSLLAKLSWPVLPDVLSGMRQDPSHDFCISETDLLLHERTLWPSLQPQAILHIGGKITSKRIQQWITASQPRIHIALQNSNQRIDPGHLLRTRCVGDLSEICSTLSSLLTSRARSNWLEKWVNLNARMIDCTNDWFNEHPELSEPRVARDLSTLAPGGSAILLAASMPIRDFEAFSKSRSHAPLLFSNRGASGIDGILATASGIAQAIKRPVSVLIGDLALLHDLNSLAMLRSMSHPLVIVVINNDGGGIFSFLPVSEHQDIFEPYFTTPHGLRFKNAAATFEIPHFAPNTPAEFQDIYLEASARPGPTVIEITTSRQDNLRVHQDIQNFIQINLNSKENTL